MHTYSWSEIRKAIAEARRAKGWTRAELGGHAGIAPRTVANYETETAQTPEVPRIEIIERLAAALGVPASAIMRGGIMESRVELDSSRGTPSAEAYLAELEAMGSPASPEAAAHLRALRHATGDVSRDAVQAEYMSWRSKQAGKAVARPSIAKPINAASGQRALPPAPKKRR